MGRAKKTKILSGWCYAAHGSAQPHGKEGADSELQHLLSDKGPSSKGMLLLGDRAVVPNEDDEFEREDDNDDEGPPWEKKNIRKPALRAHAVVLYQ